MNPLGTAGHEEMQVSFSFFTGNFPRSCGRSLRPQRQQERRDCGHAFGQFMGQTGRPGDGSGLPRGCLALWVIRSAEGG